MNVLHVIASMDPRQGGVSQAVRSMIAGLAGIGIGGEVASLDTPGQDFLAEQNQPLIHALGPGKSPWCYSPNLVSWLCSNFARFDNIIVHGLWLYPGYAVKKALTIYTRQQKSSNGNLNKPPALLVMPHGMLDPYFQETGGRKLKALRNKMYWKFIEGGIVNNADKMLFTTEEECQLARQPFSPYHPKKEAVVGLGVDEAPVYTAALQTAFAQKCPTVGQSPYLLFLSRIHKKKGLDILINAYESLLTEKTSVNKKNDDQTFPKIVIAGPGIETAYGQSIQKIVESSSQLSDNIIFAGMLTGDAKWGAFYGCEAFVLPSHQENFGIAVVEAMACGKPVLISDKVNIWREIKVTNSGIISDTTLTGVAELLKTWLAMSNESKDTMGKNAYTEFQNSFTVDAASKRLAAVLQS